MSEQEPSLQQTRRQVRRRKAWLLALLVLTALAPLAFLSLDEPTRALRLYKLLAKTGSLAGTMLLVWQMLLGFRGFAARVVSDLLWVLALHKQLGKYGILLILLHPIFITAYYAEKYGVSLLAVDYGTIFGAFIAVGIGGLAILVAIVLTSLLRRKMGYRLWYTVHLTSYLMVPAVVIHGLAIGGTIRAGALWYVWLALGGLVGILLISRTLARLGLGARRFRVTRVRRVADSTTEITMVPERPRDRIAPQAGQFAYVRPGWGSFARPFTLSRYDEASGSVAITVKALGHTSSRLQRTTVGETFHVDGPYGVFGQEAL
ncbi:MAG TPA: ferric reductase-like transmembrane domain-containing protein, partial [Phycisphaerae bacterium]|nr:ferric reductase-like transmembrane domain-containing protein [Phycisphaerae bacterium]